MNGEKTSYFKKIIAKNTINNVDFHNRPSKKTAIFLKKLVFEV
jgi:hypothetical protein